MYAVGSAGPSVAAPAPLAIRDANRPASPASLAGAKRPRSDDSAMPRSIPPIRRVSQHIDCSWQTEGYDPGFLTSLLVTSSQSAEVA